LYNFRLPDRSRPRGLRFRSVSPGLDFPCGFLDDLKAIYDKLYLVFHPYRVEFQTIMNQYVGDENDPRFCIGNFESEEVWGWVLKNPDNSPIVENCWHIWELTDAPGWGHVCKIQSRDPKYLGLLAKRLYLQNLVSLKYGRRTYMKGLQESQDKLQDKEKEDLKDLSNAVMEENAWLVNSAMDNLARGVVNPTNPTKDSIISYAGQSNKSRISRPLSDTEGGLVLPDRFKTVN